MSRANQISVFYKREISNFVHETSAIYEIIKYQYRRFSAVRPPMLIEAVQDEAARPPMLDEAIQDEAARPPMLDEAKPQ